MRPAKGDPMRRIVANSSVTLDGIAQAPGRPDEDARGGFAHGGWALPYRDSVMMQVMGKGMAQKCDLLFGRRTYEDFFKVWPSRTDNPFTAVLDNSQKYVASRTLREPLPWQNSTLLPGEAAETVARLKAEPGPDLAVLGSGALVRTLIAKGLVDTLVVSIHPLLLGRGQRLFGDDEGRVPLRLVESVATSTGVIIATYAFEGVRTEVL
jgi:dihydrofolate reductase